VQLIPTKQLHGFDGSGDITLETMINKVATHRRMSVRLAALDSDGESADGPN
jgi:uncharacterized alpha/beta hydrolase family protein